MVDRQLGVDKSHFDAPTGTSALIAQGFTFQTHKIGGDANDGEAAAWWSDSKGQRDRMLLGGYWVLYPGHGASAGDAFVARLNAVCSGWLDAPFILQLDCEEWGGNPATKPGLADIRACANRLRQLAPKLTPIVYAPRWAYANQLTGLGYPLWSSSYVSGGGTATALYPGDSYTGWAAYSGITPTIAQFSSTATAAGDTTTDVNAFRGSLAALTSIVAPGWESTVATDWNADAVLGVNYFFSEAYRAMQGKATGSSSADKNARNARAYLLGVLGPSITDVKTSVLAAIAGEPGADAIAAAVLSHLNSESADDMATALRAVLTPEQLAALVELLTAPAPAPTEQAVEFAEPDSGLPVYDETADAFTRQQREARQSDIAGS